MTGGRTSMKWMACIAGLCVLIAPGWSSAKDPLITDRPDFTESAFVVGRGTVQLDVRAARRLSSEGPDLIIGLGASARF